MTTPQEDGASYRDHLLKAAEGFLPLPSAVAKLAEEPPCPPGAFNVWAIFLELHLRRQQSEFGPLRFPWHELQAYSQVTGLRLTSWERKTIFALEDAFFEVKSENDKAKKPKTPNTKGKAPNER